MFYVYVLEDERRELYTGFTRDLKKRLVEHNRGDTKSTRGQRWKCIYYEACLDQHDAERRERYLKLTQGKRMLRRRLKEYFYNRKTN